jgi:ABC-2 type transport system ATP-binding protein
MLELDGIVRHFGERRVLDGVTFRVRPGEVVGFIGRNGAGKTTTMRVVMGLLEPDGGQVRWDGRPLVEGRRRRIGYLPEERGLYPKMRCVDQLRFLAQLAGVPKRASRAHVVDLLEGLGLSDRLDSPVEQLSLGNQQRVQLAAALLGRPALLVLDEPFSGLDPTGVDVLTAALERRVEDGVGVLFSSHQLDLLERVARRVVMIEAGRIVLDQELGAVASAGQVRLVDRFRERLSDGGERSNGSLDS